MPVVDERERGDKKELVLGATTGLATAVLAFKVGVVDLDRSYVGHRQTRLKLQSVHCHEGILSPKTVNMYKIARSGPHGCVWLRIVANQVKSCGTAIRCGKRCVKGSCSEIGLRKTTRLAGKEQG